jgi:hypothetical protein
MGLTMDYTMKTMGDLTMKHIIICHYTKYGIIYIINH